MLKNQVFPPFWCVLSHLLPKSCCLGKPFSAGHDIIWIVCGNSIVVGRSVSTSGSLITTRLLFDSDGNEKIKLIIIIWYTPIRLDPHKCYCLCFDSANQQIFMDLWGPITMGLYIKILSMAYWMDTYSSCCWCIPFFPTTLLFIVYRSMDGIHESGKPLNILDIQMKRLPVQYQLLIWTKNLKLGKTFAPTEYPFCDTWSFMMFYGHWLCSSGHCWNLIWIIRVL